MTTEGKETTIPLARIRTDEGTQAREFLRDDVIEEYAERYRSKQEMPRVVVFCDGDEFWLADGFHRLAGAKAAGLEEIEVELKQGGRRDAILFAVGANSEHGVRRTNEDKRKAIAMLLADETWAKQTNQWIADQCHVSDDLVAKVRSVSSLGNTQTERRSGRDGKTYSSRKPRKKRREGSQSGQIVFSWPTVDSCFGGLIRELDKLPKAHKGWEDAMEYQQIKHQIRQMANLIKALKKRMATEAS
jgi:hypothetical protein